MSGGGGNRTRPTAMRWARIAAASRRSPYSVEGKRGVRAHIARTHRHRAGSVDQRDHGPRRFDLARVLSAKALAQCARRQRAPGAAHNVNIEPRGLLRRGFRRAQPHIFSAQETCALLHGTSPLGPAGGLRPRTYTTLFGLLTATGLRISEALALTCPDVDLDGATLGSRRVREAERASSRSTAPRGQHRSSMLAGGSAGIRSRGQMRSS
jgi:integrase